MSVFTLNKTLALLGRAMNPEEAVRPEISLPHEKPSLPLRPSPSPLPRCTPEEAGVSSALVADFLDKLQKDDSLNMHAVLLARGGRIFCEAAFGMQDLRAPKYLFSASKSFVSLAVGILCGEGKLSLEEKLSDLFPEETGTLPRLIRRVPTVRQLLTMTAGSLFNEAESMAEREWVRAFLNATSYGELGKTFYYNSLNTYVLAAAVVRRSGESLTEYLTKRLFAPLGITDLYWEKSPEGIEKGGWGLYLRGEDLVKVGTLLQNGGVWEGKRLIPADYLREAISEKIRTPEAYGAFNYAYQIWTGRRRDSFLFNGMLGQNLYCNTENGVIAVFFAGNDDMFQQSSVFTYLLERFTGPFPDALSPDPAGEAALRQKLAELTALPLPAAPLPPAPPKPRSLFARLRARFGKDTPPDETAPAPSPAECLLLCGRSAAAPEKGGAHIGFFPFLMQIIQNNYTAGLEEISFSLQNGVFLLRYREKDACYTVPVGFYAPADGELNVGGDSFRVRSIGRFSRDLQNRLVLEVRTDFLELPVTRLLTFAFGESTVLLSQRELPGRSAALASLASTLSQYSDLPFSSALSDRLSGPAARQRIAAVFEPEITLSLSAPATE
ncbi:MAG: serine hydrolase [Clostridia bacterium]|nr:serine hydrolase [Clostridia bacterium]